MLVLKELVVWWVKHYSLRLHVLFNRKNNNNNNNNNNNKITLDLFTIPIMSAECERVFSTTKNLTTERRMGLKEDIIKAISLLRHWYKESGVI